MDLKLERKEAIPIHLISLFYSTKLEDDLQIRDLGTQVLLLSYAVEHHPTGISTHLFFPI